MKHERDPGLQPGQLRYDSVLKTLTALKRFSRALETPPTDQLQKMDRICSETFCFTQERIIGAIRRKTVLARRAVIKSVADATGEVKISKDGAPANGGNNLTPWHHITEDVSVW
jgi:hypothetical protein